MTTTTTAVRDVLDEAIQMAKERRHETTVEELMQILDEACDAEDEPQ